MAVIARTSVFEQVLKLRYTVLVPIREVLPILSPENGPPPKGGGPGYGLDTV